MDLQWWGWGGVGFLIDDYCNQKIQSVNDAQASYTVYCTYKHTGKNWEHNYSNTVSSTEILNSIK